MPTVPMTPEQQVEFDQAKATEPIPYRGYLIKFTSFHQPYWLDRKFVFFGWNILSADGFTNMGPGCTWGRTIGDAKGIIDCLHEAGHEPECWKGPIPTTDEEREAYAVHQAKQEAFNTKFWALIRERHPAA